MSTVKSKDKNFNPYLISVCISLSSLFLCNEDKDLNILEKSKHIKIIQN